MAATIRKKGRSKGKTASGRSRSPQDRTLRVLCVHGVGNHSRNTEWQRHWIDAITLAVTYWRPNITIQPEFVMYDDLFEQHPVNPITIAGAVARMLSSGLVHGIGDLLRARRGGSRGLSDVTDRLRWTAGMVAQWAHSGDLRQESRARIADRVRAFQPDVIAAHSLGSLICYDTFIPRTSKRNGDAHGPHDHELLNGRFFLTFGSQIGNPFVRGTFGGRLTPLTARFWYHLYNPRDDVLTSDIPLAYDRFRRITTEFDLPGWGDHDAPMYLSHSNAVAGAWRRIVQTSQADRQTHAGAGSAPQPTVITPTAYTTDADLEAACCACDDPLFGADLAVAHICRRTKRRALLVGINNYPSKTDRLDGCINDVYLINSILQECDFAPEDVRVVLDDRATTDGIRDRLHWLLDGTRDGDQRLFFYSGHGAQMPGYGIGETVDRLDECLVPFDFDWTPAHAILDDEIYDLYSQLPYGCHFLMVLDCCHSAGMTRDGGARVRGLAPPDDIRHRLLKWDHRAERREWTARTSIASPNPSLATLDVAADYLGQSKCLRRLGRSITLRSLPNDEYDAARSEYGHYGPYLPLILQACQEHEFAYEYRHGSTPYGAFTFSLSDILRASRVDGISLTYEQLMTTVRDRLRDLRYAQTPALTGPGFKRTSPIALTPERSGARAKSES